MVMKIKETQGLILKSRKGNAEDLLRPNYYYDKMRLFFDSNPCDNRERRSTWAEERVNTNTFETPVCPNGGYGGYRETVATKTEEASGSVAAEEMVEVTEGLPLSSKWIQRRSRAQRMCRF